MNPMAADTLRGIPVINNATIPPMRAKGTFSRMSKALLTDLKASKSRTKMRKTLTGTITARGVHEDIFDVRHFALGLVEADHDAEVLLTFPQLGGRPPTEGGFNHILDIGDVQTVTGGAGPIDLDLELGHFAPPVDECAGHAADRRDGVQDFLRLLAQHRAVVAKDFDHDLAVNLR